MVIDKLLPMLPSRHEDTQRRGSKSRIPALGASFYPFSSDPVLETAMTLFIHVGAVVPDVVNAARQLVVDEQRNAVLSYGKATSKPTKRSNTATPPS